MRLRERMRLEGIYPGRVYHNKDNRSMAAAGASIERPRPSRTWTCVRGIVTGRVSPTGRPAGGQTWLGRVRGKGLERAELKRSRVAKGAVVVLPSADASARALARNDGCVDCHECHAEVRSLARGGLNTGFLQGALEIWKLASEDSDTRTRDAITYTLRK